MAKDWDDDLDDELPDEADLDDSSDDDEDDLLWCPSCRGQVHEDTQKCPHCGDWMTPVDRSRPVGRVLMVVTALALIAAILLIWV